MPRDGSGIYTQPFPDVDEDTTIESAVYNGFVADVAQDLNAPRPIIAGGTGATNANDALAAMGAEKSMQAVTNFDSHVWLAGSFWSATTASGEPVDGRAFSGIVYMADSSNIVVEARDATDGKLYIRRKTAGVWGAWALDGDLSGVNTDIAAIEADIVAIEADIAAVEADIVTIESNVTTLQNGKVAKAGDTMTGPLVLPAAAPTLGTHATNKTYVDAADAALAASVVSTAVRYDLAQTLTAPQRTQARTNISVPLRGHIFGLTLSAAGSTATFGVAAGEAADSTGVDLLSLASAYTKTTSAWAVGSGNGAMDTSTVANSTWYYVFVIKRVDTGVVDVLFSLSATAPTLPASYTLFRRIGAMKTSGAAQWIKFFQNGDNFIWDVPVNDGVSFSPAGGVNTTLSVPAAIYVVVDIGVVFASNAADSYLVVHSTLITNQTAGVPSANYLVYVRGTSEVHARRLQLGSANGAVRSASAGPGTHTENIVTHGWSDTRGRLA